MAGQQLCKAARDGDAAKVSTLLSTQGAQFFFNYQDALGATPIFIAALHGHGSVTKQLIEACCNMDLQAVKQRCKLLSARGTPQSPNRKPKSALRPMKDTSLPG